MAGRGDLQPGAAGFYLDRVDPMATRSAFLPHWDVSGPTWRYVSLPLWLPCVICLAWPVTSFIIARRRHKRGFPVEPKGGGESVSTTVSSS